MSSILSRGTEPDEFVHSFPYFPCLPMIALLAMVASFERHHLSFLEGPLPGEWKPEESILDLEIEQWIIKAVQSWVRSVNRVGMEGARLMSGSYTEKPSSEERRFRF